MKDINKLINKAYKEDDGIYYLSDDALRKFMKNAIHHETKEELEKDLFDYFWQMKLIERYIFNATEKRKRLKKKQINKILNMLEFLDRNIEE